MFEIEIVLKNAENKYQEISLIKSGQHLESLKTEISNFIFDSISESGSYYVEIIILEDGEYFDKDEFIGFFDIDQRVVTQPLPDSTPKVSSVEGAPSHLKYTDVENNDSMFQKVSLIDSSNTFEQQVAV